MDIHNCSHYPVHHVGYLVKDISPAIDRFRMLGFVPSTEKTRDSVRGIDIIFLNNTAYTIELVAPVNKDSIVYNLLKKVGSSPYHFCYEVENLEKAVQDFENTGYRVIDGAKPACALENKRVVFLYCAEIGIIELLER